MTAITSVKELERTAQPNEANVELKNEMTRQERKARLVQILDRGLVHDRLSVVLPPDKHGEWVRANPMDIDAMRTLGFEVDNEFSTKRTIHADGSSSNKVGDVIYMTCPKETKELIDEIRLEQSERANNPRKVQREETEFRNQTHRDTGDDIGTFVESKTRAVTRDQLKETLGKIDQQIQPQR